MSKGDEPLQENPFLQTLQSKFSELYDAASSNKYLILVPAKDSLGLAKLDQPFMETHILKESPYFKQEYVTLNGKTLLLRGTFCLVGCGA